MSNSKAPRSRVRLVRPITTLLLSGVLTSCANTPESATRAVATSPVATTAAVSAAADADVQRAKAAAQAFSTRLREQLMQQMGQGGPVAAVDFCATEAPKIAASVGAEYGVRLGRVAVNGRNRNPANVAHGWQAEALARVDQAVMQGGKPQDQVVIVRRDLPAGTTLGFFKGIAVEPQCLGCHGSAVPASVEAAIRRHYPGDRATGFSVGDLRGGLWVEVPAAQVSR